MRDALDPGTIEMPLQKKRGRPAKYSFGAMTPAERAKSYRENRKLEARQALPSIIVDANNPVRDVAILDALRKAVAAGDARAIYELTSELRDRYPSLRDA